MRKEFFLVSAGAVLFNTIFWEEKIGVNTILFDLFVIGAIFYLYPEARKKALVMSLFAAHVVSLSMLLTNNSGISKSAFCITLMLLAAFAEYVHYSPWYAGGSFLLNIGLLPASLAEKWKSPSVTAGRQKSFSRLLRFSFFPMLLLLVFFMIYQLSNSVFAALVDHLLLQVEHFFASFFSWFSFGRLLFLAAGFYLVGSILLKTRVNYFSIKDTSSTNDLERNRRHIKERKHEAEYDILLGVLGRFAGGIMGLKNVNTIGITSLLLLNLLLLVVNIIDIRYIWFDFNFSPNANIYNMVHEGTELLIVSIVLAMMLLIFLFKGNLNFYKRNMWLKVGAYAWIFQNIILVISVLLRDYYYIEFFGLAYKRIGVLFFLFAVLTGLATVFIKIRFRKSNYFLFRVNAWACIFMLVVSSSVNWDPMIADYNFRHNEKVPVDLEFIFSLSDKALPVIDRNIGLIQAREKQQTLQLNSEGKCINCYTEMLNDRKQQFLQSQQQYSWLSWNYADHSVQQYLSGKSANQLSHK